MTAAANIFNAATIIYQLYTARSPFSGPHLGEVDRSITDVDPHPMQMAHPRVPEAISKVVLKALAKNPAERYCERPAILCRAGRSRKSCAGFPRQQHRINARL